MSDKHLNYRAIIVMVLAISLLGACAQEATEEESTQEAGGSITTSSDGLPAKTGFLNLSDIDGKPERGGTLSVGVWVEARTLDPARAPSFGSSGGMEVAAIFDVLVHYDPISGEYEPWMAKSLEHNEDFTKWTLGLREGILFTDGTPLNAEAVALNMNRARDGRYGPLVSEIAEIETPDSQTVVFQLKEPWSRFSWLLSIGPGPAASPSAIKKWGDEFETHPVGAGPFVLNKWAPGEEMVLTANEGYWGEGPYIDKLRFIPLGGDQARLDSLSSGGIQAAHMRDPNAIVAAIEAGFGGFVHVSNSADALAINHSEGRPGADLKVRKAIAYSFNGQQFNQRVYDGNGLISNEMFAPTSRWATTAEATSYDIKRAKELVAEAKSGGFDGNIAIVTANSTTRRQQALALQAQLNAAGFNASVEYAPSAAALYGRIIKASYDVAFYGIGIPDGAPWARLEVLLSTNGSQNRMNYSDPQMDGLLNELHDATTSERKQEVLNDIQIRWRETVPLLTLTSNSVFIPQADNVHGLVPTALETMLFAQAWLSN